MVGEQITWIRLWACVLSIFFCGALSSVSGATRGLQIVDPHGQAVGLYKASYALVIGVSNYKRGWPSLPGVARDTDKVKAALEEQGFEVKVVKDPTKSELYKAMEDFLNERGLEPENRLLFYYAGHGHTLKTISGDMGYLVPADAPDPNKDRNGFLAKAMDMEQIDGYAKRIQAKHALFLFDSCFSGFFSQTRALPEYISYKTSQPVRQFITSGSADETVPDQSIFTQQFLAALQGEADANRDGYLTGTELGEFLKDRVINYSGSSQHPQYGKIRNPNLDKGDFVFKVTITVTSSPSGTQVEVTSQPSDLEQRLAALEKQRMQGGGGPDPEAEMWNLVKDSNHAEDIRTFLRQYPEGRYASVARLKVQQLERQAALPPPSASPPPARPPRQESLTPPPPAAAPTSPSQFSRAEIREAQRLLKKVGLDPGPADGAFGQKTAEALRQYQSQRSLPVTGVPDSATMEALNLGTQPPQRPPQAEVQVAVVVPPPKPPAPPAPSVLRNNIGMEFVRIPAGDFLMGSSDGAPDQKPLHKVTISRPFYLGKYEVTQAQWMEVMGSNPSLFKEDRKAGGGIENVGKEIGGFFRRIGGKDGGNEQERSSPQTPANILDRPVERVSWMQARDFILKLNQREGHEKYRLPTEAEWEYAARAGSTGAYGEGNDEREIGKYAWYLPNAENTTHPVGQRSPNAWGLYDMQGNVLEWVWDRWAPNYSSAALIDPKGATTGSLQVLRGCGWPHVAGQCRLAQRFYDAPTVPKHFYGFRLARDLP